MNIQELLKTETSFNVTIGINDLRQWHNDVIASTKKELEDAVIKEKTESYLTAKQVSEMLKVDPVTLWRWNKRGYLKHLEIGGGRRYKLSEVKALLK